MTISTHLAGGLAETAERSLKEVFSKQLRLTLEPCSEESDHFDTQTLHASLSITGERLKGSVLLQVSESFAAKATKIFLGCEGEGDEIRDVTGEICNMVSGRIKSELTKAGFSGILGTPTVTCGSRIALRDTPGSELCRTEWVCGTDHINLQILIIIQP